MHLLNIVFKYHISEIFEDKTDIAQGAEEFSSSKSIKKSSYLLKCNHGFRFPLKTSSSMHLCKFVTDHCFKTDTTDLFSIVLLRAPLF